MVTSEISEMASKNFVIAQSRQDNKLMIRFLDPRFSRYLPLSDKCQRAFRAFVFIVGKIFYDYIHKTINEEDPSKPKI